MNTITFMDLWGTFKRRIIPILIFTILCAGGVAGYGVLQNNDVIATSYTAEATIYVNGYDANEVEDYNYVFDNSTLFNNARRIILSDSVSGEVKRELEQKGIEVTITTPYWVDSETATRFTSNFVFVDATATDADAALEAADLVAEKALAEIQATLPVTEASIYENAVLTSGDGTKAAIPGSEVTGSDVATSQDGDGSGGISKKLLLVAALLGFFGAAFCFCAYEVLNRRIRVARDVEVLMGVPVIAEIPCKEGTASSAARREFSFLATNVQVLMPKDAPSVVAIAGITEKDKTSAVVTALADELKRADISVETVGVESAGTANLSRLEERIAAASAKADLVLVDAGALAQNATGTAAVRAASAVLVATVAGNATSPSVKSATEQLQIAGTPVLGAALLTKNKK